MELTHREGQVCISIDGPVRLGETAELHTLSLAAVEAGVDVVVDLTEADHLHAAALQVLRALEVHLHKHGRNFCIRAPSERAARAVRLVGLGEWLHPLKEAG
jgi:anti-anti-sigma factor